VLGSRTMIEIQAKLICDVCAASLLIFSDATAKGRQFHLAKARRQAAEIGWRRQTMANAGVSDFCPVCAAKLTTDSGQRTKP
jgi:hypothetical protein